MDAVAQMAQVAQVVTGITSTLIALLALAVAVRSDRRSREALKVQTYLQLRSRFIDIYQELGHMENVEPDNIKLRLARQAYWYHVWDEWYICNRLASKEFSELWKGFFAAGAISAYSQAALKASLEKLAAMTDRGFGAYAQDLLQELRAMEGESSEPERPESKVHQHPDRTFTHPAAAPEDDAPRSIPPNGR